MSASDRCADQGKRKGRVHRSRFCIAIPSPVVPRFVRRRILITASPPVGRARSVRLLAREGQRLFEVGTQSRGPGRAGEILAGSSPQPHRWRRARGLGPSGSRSPEAGSACVPGAVRYVVTPSARAAAPVESPPSLVAAGVAARHKKKTSSLPSRIEQDREAGGAILTLPPGAPSHSRAAYFSPPRHGADQRRAKRSIAPMSPSR